MSDRTSGTFGGWSDRLTYVVAEAQLLVAGLFISLGLILLWVRPEVPGIPPWVGAIVAALLLLGPPLFGFFVQLIRKFRNRGMVDVHHVNAKDDVLEKYQVAPEIWSEKKIEGANPYPVNGGGAWAVREFEFQEDTDQLIVRGVWLSEVEDVRLMTSKTHMESIYEKLTESHLALQVIRDSVSELGADIQGALINSMAEAREKGRMMDQHATKNVFDDFREDVEEVGTDDLPTIEDADLPGGDLDELAEEVETPDPLGDSMGMGGEQPTAADGGTTDD